MCGRIEVRSSIPEGIGRLECLSLKFLIDPGGRRRSVSRRPGAMYGQPHELRQDRKVATVVTFSQCRGMPGHLFFKC